MSMSKIDGCFVYGSWRCITSAYHVFDIMSLRTVDLWMSFYGSKHLRFLGTFSSLYASMWQGVATVGSI